MFFPIQVPERHVHPRQHGRDLAEVKVVLGDESGHDTLALVVTAVTQQVNTLRMGRLNCFSAILLALALITVPASGSEVANAGEANSGCRVKLAEKQTWMVFSNFAKRKCFIFLGPHTFSLSLRSSLVFEISWNNLRPRTHLFQVTPPTTSRWRRDRSRNCNDGVETTTSGRFEPTRGPGSATTFAV